MQPYTLKRSKRRTTVIYIKNGIVEIRAPHAMPLRDIENFLKKNAEWVAKKLLLTPPQTIITYGSLIPYRAKKYPIVASDHATRIGFDGVQFFVPHGLSPAQIRDACIQIYRLLAKRDIPTRVAALATKMSVSPKSIKITSAKTRWGSCTSRRSLNFSWRLILVDDACIDYIIIHELAHLIELNHSKKFWAIVEKVLPDYKVREKLLREREKVLVQEVW